MDDQTLLQHITELVHEEQQLRASAQTPQSNSGRLRHIEEELDQCWDLLRQRRAKREFNDDPDTARMRAVDTVEHYEQ